MQCPSCELPLRAVDVSGERLERCGACGGEFCAHEVLRRLVAVHAPEPGAFGRDYSRPSPFSDPVRYRKCPLCMSMMLRKNFRESSGIIVDICSPHGVWFDHGELGKVFEFVRTGAMAIADRLAAQRRDDRRRLDAFAQRLRASGPKHYIGVRGGMSAAIDGLADIARIVDLDDD